LTQINSENSELQCCKRFISTGTRIIVLIRDLNLDLQTLYMENKLKTRHKLYLVALTVLLGFSSVASQADGVQQDARAIEVLKQMSAYKSSLNQVVIKGVTFTDARLGGGLIVSNAEEVSVSIKRPGSMLITSSDGEATKGFYFHNGLFTLFNSAKNLYGQADIPKEIEAAINYALNELGIEAPLMDMLYKDAATHLITSNETILYLTDKARVGGADCHHLAIRSAEADVQLWVEEGERPLTRKIVITSKWEGGSPRFTANLDWDTNPEFKPGIFEFKAPEGATKIEFITQGSEQ
jgi:hypothetical protein